ncbi:cytosolic carboxypeptidase 3 isoform X4 [Elephas maximus indicus]|uniref:cytosolic carboxypeptidase 3 isoform X4 n=1 Tax=Elephas maximus indicus TaxID=99487 RepID=UPI002116F653|nr:cytosolic carboxypeptidase 3 isoform X4 [Elephas maximus indicus]
MSEDSENENYSDRTISDEDESDEDEDNFMKFVREDIRRCALLTAGSIGDPFFPRTTQILLEYQLGRWVPRLREPRDLYGVSSSGPLSPTRWPYHCEVIDEKVQHIDWTPPYPEPVYTPTGLETEPLYLNSKDDVVYLAEDAYKEPCFVYSRVGGNRTSLKQPMDNCDNTLMFEARFESGNLQKVVKVAEYEYQLTVRPDLFTNKHTQWYYFQVTNTQAEIAYRFTIVNFTKPASLYNRGMRPLFYSEKEAKVHNIGWKRIGDQIKYYKNNLGQDGRHYFSLTWTFQFPHNKDTCYFAHCYPYTYSNLQDYLSGINNDPVRSKFCKIRVLCHTLARNMVYVLTITTPLKNTELRKRKAVILTARVHPGETNSSWIMKGFLDYILGGSSDAKLLRDTFIFKVVPMLNPDGVIVGNYRCSLAGRDLNRSYTSVLKESFPSVWYTRNMIRRLMEKREVILYCDLHGHSRKENIFMYGCDGSDRSKALYLQQRIFPLMLSKNCPDKFSFSACKFNVQKSKEGTGRVVMWKMGIRNSFTMEATFCGSTLGNKRGTHFNTKDLESMGYHFCDSLLDYCDPDRAKYFQCLKELEEMEKRINLEKIFDDSDTSLVEITLDLESSSRGSDSSESNDSQPYLLKLTSQLKTKKHLKTKKERNSTIEIHENAREEQEVCGREHLQQRYNESNANLEDLHHNLKSKMKGCTSFQSKKTDVNWTDDEKRIYRDKRIAQTQEMWHFLLPVVESSKHLPTTQIKQIFNPRANFQFQHQLKPATCINVKRDISSWAPSRNPIFLAQRDLVTNSSEWFQSMSQKSLEILSPLKDPKNRKKYPGVWAIKTEAKKPFSTKWETTSSSGEMDANITKDKSLQAKESSPQSSVHVARHLTENKEKQPNKNDGQPTCQVKFRRSN